MVRTEREYHHTPSNMGLGASLVRRRGERYATLTCSPCPGKEGRFTLHDICTLPDTMRSDLSHGDEDNLRGVDSELGECASDKEGDGSEGSLHGKS